MLSALSMCEETLESLVSVPAGKGVRLEDQCASLCGRGAVALVCFVITTSRSTASGFRNLGRLCLRCRCFCNQNMGRSTTDPRRFRRLRGATSTWPAFPFLLSTNGSEPTRLFPILVLALYRRGSFRRSAYILLKTIEQTLGSGIFSHLFYNLDRNATRCTGWGNVGSFQSGH